MLRILQFEKENQEIQKIDFENMDFDSLKWLDCYNPHEEELEKIKKFLNIPQTDLDRALDEDEKPSIKNLDNYSMIIFSNPVKAKKSIETSSFAILVSENLLITIRKRNVDALNNLWNTENNVKKKFFSKGSSHLTYQLLEKVMDHYFSAFNEIEKDINKLENEVFESAEKKLVKEIFSLKKTLIFFHRSLASNRDVAFNIVNGYAEKINPKDASSFRYVQEDIVQLIDVVATYREIIMSSLDVYLSNVSNNMNKVMKKMAAFGSLILVPTFITGLYGMNFRFLPELEWRFGYVFAWSVIILSVALLYWYFRKKDWF